MDTIVVVISREVAKPFVIKHHYTQAMGKASLITGLWRGSDLVGVITFGQPSGRLVASSLGYTEKTCWEFLRMVVLDDEPTPRTYFMGQSIKILRQKHPQVKMLVTYADQTEGHTGTVYKAGSWEYHGMTAAKYHYIRVPDGMRFNKRIPWDYAKRYGITELEASIILELVKVKELPKLRFIKKIR